MKAVSADNPARLSLSDPAHLRLKPHGFVDTETLDEITMQVLIKNYEVHNAKTNYIG
ncbi:hypothetical protein [Paenibacillus solani]|uniref:hypothetical protein n=1 Tax=Paenibacillus solani TaxID=1705565 RepID=UPI003D2BE8D8